MNEWLDQNDRIHKEIDNNSVFMREKRFSKRSSKEKIKRKMSNTNTLDSLNILLNAPSKAAVEQLINVVFLTRHQAIVAIPEDSQKIDDSHQQAFDPVKVKIFLN